MEFSLDEVWNRLFYLWLAILALCVGMLFIAAYVSIGIRQSIARQIKR